MSAVIYEHILH